mmetsp:Transcript_64907/g.120796  ORF Transcript_64907/g.120796 Transcript_64907/m.120796 type:complete len:211 (+) Transcript_64907:74-706(+)
MQDGPIFDERPMKVLPEHPPEGTDDELEVSTKYTFIHVTMREPEVKPSGPPVFSCPPIPINGPFELKAWETPSTMSTTEALALCQEGRAPSETTDDECAAPQKVTLGSGFPVMVHLDPLSMSEKEALHYRKECTPCAYFARKADGCRSGDGCQFCHLCDAGEIKRRKKAKWKAMREAGMFTEARGAHKKKASKKPGADEPPALYDDADVL